MDTEFLFSIINKYFDDNPNVLVRHHHDSFNAFYKTGLKNILTENNPITILKQQDEGTKEFMLQCRLFIGGKDGSKIYYGKPMIYDEKYTHYMLPNEARLRNMTYGFSIHYDVDVEFNIYDPESPHEAPVEKSITLEKMFLGRFPIMLQSNLCVLQSLAPKVRFEVGECVNDPGGYFIIDGKEKVIVCQEKFADNMLYTRDKYSDVYNFSVEVKSASEDASKPVRTTAIRMVAPTPTSANGQLSVVIPNVRKPMPLFIVMRALGVLSDYDIIQTCLLDMEKNKSYVDLFIPCVYDAAKIFTQDTAIRYIATFTKGKTAAHVLDILTNLFLPHVGDMNFREKAHYLGYMAFKLMKVAQKEEPPTDRDNFKFKRVELAGTLLNSLFKEYYKMQRLNIFQNIDKEYYYHAGQYEGERFVDLIKNNTGLIFKDRMVEDGFRKAFKGNWGAEAHTKRPGVVQDLNRLSFNSALAQRRKINLPLDESAKVVGPRLLHGSQWGIIDPLDTPDGGNVGLHKHMSIAAQISTGYSKTQMLPVLERSKMVSFLGDATPALIATGVKVLLNGDWVGITQQPKELKNVLIFMRRIALIPNHTSITWNIAQQTFEIYTDAGRLVRPVFYINEDKEIPVYLPHYKERIDKGKFSWNDLILGFSADGKTIPPNQVSRKEDVYGEMGIEELNKNKAIIDFIDCAEEENAFIAAEVSDQGMAEIAANDYTHLDIHPSLMLGVMGNQIIYPENNQLPRNLFSCGQSKQGVSWYHTNYQNRIDKMSVVLNYGEIPLVKSRYMKPIQQEKQPYGENVIVAIGCYGGYNVEDSILFNEGSLKRGLFHTTYYNSYESREESSSVKGTMVDSKFTNIEAENVIGLKAGYDYSALDEYGMIEENTRLNEKMVLIGKANVNLEDPSTKIDNSVYPKKGQLGYVDKTFMTDGEEGFRLAKVRIREDRVPAVGDKFCSRCGQKGTIGLIIPEENMPFTAEGVRPDLIVNPHAFPSRMTIGQLVEVLVGKAGIFYGAYGDCTAFVNKGPKNDLFGRLLTDVGYNKTGNEILYNGETGEQLEAQIYMGPTYYMRLKHMVKDKINYRAQGPRTLLTRQTVQGRANDGGLRVGEMERDGLIAHGMAGFLEDSMMNRGDEYYMAVCNQTGSIAIYNESRNLFLSPMADGPIKFNGEIDDKMSIENVSRFGRDFSIVRVPYSFKLLIQELMTMNVQVRIITEANIDQLTALNYSNNLEIRLGDVAATAKKVAADTMTKQRADVLPEPLAVDEAQSYRVPSYAYDLDRDKPVYSPRSPTYAPSSPMYVADVVFRKGDVVFWNKDTDSQRKWTIVDILTDQADSVENVYVLESDDSQYTPFPSNVTLSDEGRKARALAKKMEISLSYPAYMPRSPDYVPRSPDYVPRSPDYEPRSPDYVPRSPDYEPRSPDYEPRSPSEGPRTPPEDPNSSVEFSIGDLVNLTNQDIAPWRTWEISNINKENDQYTLITSETYDLPKSATLSENGKVATILANKHELKYVIPWKPHRQPSPELAPLSPPDPRLWWKQDPSTRSPLPAHMVSSRTPPWGRAQPRSPSFEPISPEGPPPLSFSPISPDMPPPPDVPLDLTNVENLPVSRRPMRIPTAQPVTTQPSSPIEKYLPPKPGEPLSPIATEAFESPNSLGSPIDKYLPPSNRGDSPDVFKFKPK